MPASSAQGLKPRKTPLQARSAGTVKAISDATIQVLLVDGAARLTTTRVATRAGVSVGTMYQYFPNKQALLHAVLKRHLDDIVTAVDACPELSGDALRRAHAADASVKPPKPFDKAKGRARLEELLASLGTA